jgi:hypothetical protein
MTEMMPVIEENHGPPQPVPVPVSGEVDIRLIHGSMIVHEEAGDYGAYFTITLAGTEQPINLLPYDVNRHVAYITCTGTGPVYIGSASGVQAMRNGQTAGQAPAFILATGITLPVTHKQAVFIAPNGTNTATVSVAVERWES